MFLKFRIASLCFVYIFLFPCFCQGQISPRSELEKYVQVNSKVRDIHSLTDETDTFYSASFTSQTWRGNPWTHIVRMYAPKNGVRYSDSIYFLVTGSKDPKKYSAELQAVANRTGAFAAAIGSVPNQPLFGDLTEDKLLAYSFKDYDNSAESDWPILLPMVASVVRGLDLVENELRKRALLSSNSHLRAVVGGASKRGWTTWLMPIVDSRVVAIVPAVFDMLNIPAQIEHARAAYGRDSPKIKAYTELGLTDKVNQGKISKLVKLIDPFSYRARLTVPKLLILGTNDPYWVTDSFSQYGSKLPGITSILESPNTGHSALSVPEVQSALATWLTLIAMKAPIPVISSTTTQSKDGLELTINSSLDIVKMVLWSADADTKDFREATWYPEKALEFGGVKTWLHSVPYPQMGLRAFFVEIFIETAAGVLRQTTEVRVIAQRENLVQ